MYLISVKKDSHIENEIDSTKDHYGTIAIITAFASIICFSFRDFLLRYYKVTKDYPAFELSLDSLTLYSFGCCCYAFYYFVILGHNFYVGSLYYGIMSAILNTAGFMLIGIAVVIGYAGPANALNSIQAIILTLISASVLN